MISDQVLGLVYQAPAPSCLLEEGLPSCPWFQELAGFPLFISSLALSPFNSNAIQQAM